MFESPKYVFDINEVDSWCALGDTVVVLLQLNSTLEKDSYINIAGICVRVVDSQLQGRDLCAVRCQGINDFDTKEDIESFIEQINTPDDRAQRLELFMLESLANTWEPNTAVISSFRHEHRFLSNFYESDKGLRFEGLSFNNVECAYQLAKVHPLHGDYAAHAMHFSGLSPAQSKKQGKKLPLREDWEEIKCSIMHKLVLTKFLSDSGLANKLLATGRSELIEGNDWGDTYWGVCNTKNFGQNHLGRILMSVRDTLWRI